MYINQIRTRYLSADKVSKSRILDEYCNICGYTRKHAIRAINAAGQSKGPNKGPKPKYPAEQMLEPLERIWLMAERPCSKQLKLIMDDCIGAYQAKYGMLDSEVVNKLFTISSATIDRLLRKSKYKGLRKGISGTTIGTLLKAFIDVSDNQWDNKRPGYIEADTVAMCGDSIQGQFIWCLNMTDVASGWTEVRACWGKSSEAVLDKMREVEGDLPIPMLGFDCDNGSEFLNYKILEYLQKRKHPVQFTRSRPYRKNDNAHIEQKNYTHVRKILGYERYDVPEVTPLVNKLMKDYSMFKNFVIPCSKTIEKVRVGSRIKRKMDEPKTPYKRLLAAETVDILTKRKLTEKYQTINPFDLKEDIDKQLLTILKIIKAAKAKGTMH